MDGNRKVARIGLALRHDLPGMSPVANDGRVAKLRAPSAWLVAFGVLPIVLATVALPMPATAAPAMRLAQADADLPLEELKPPETTFGDPSVIDLTEGQKTYAQTSETAATEFGGRNTADTSTLARETATQLAVVVLAVVVGLEVGRRAAPVCRSGMLILATALGGFVVVTAVLAGGTSDSYAAGVAAVVAVTMAATAVACGLVVAARELGNPLDVPQLEERS
jgi:hypothetical protein